MTRTGTIRCVCCGLDQAVPLDDGGAPPTRCPRCRAHDGASRADEPGAAAARDADHALMYRRAMLDAEDDTVLARGERDYYRDKMRDVYTVRELLVGVLSKIDDVHHVRGTRCVCGTAGCRVVDLLADPRISRLITAYDEQRRTLRELRNANPELWTDTWDGIDVTLVHPRPATPAAGRGRGRHRAAG